MSNDKEKLLRQNAETLNKLLNHRVFLDKFPEIRDVDARQFGNGIDVILMFSEDIDYRTDYKKFGPEAHEMVRFLARIAGVKDLLKIYPQLPTQW